MAWWEPGKYPHQLDTLTPQQNSWHFSNAIFECFSVNESYGILIQISLKFISRCPIVNMSPLVQVMACQRIGDKPLPEQMRPNLWHHWVMGAHKSLRTCLLNQWTNIIPLLPRICNQFFHLPLARSRRKLTLVVHSRSRGFQVVTTRGIHNLEFSYWCLAYNFISMNIWWIL